MNKPAFITSAETRLIEQAMRVLSVGETITYGRIKDICGSPHDQVYSAVRTALKRLLRDEGMVFAVIRGVGYKRLNSKEIVEESFSATERIRRASRRALEKQLKADFNELAPQIQAKASATASVLGTIAMMSKPAEIEKLGSKIEQGTRELPFLKTLELFSKETAP